MKSILIKIAIAIVITMSSECLALTPTEHKELMKDFEDNVKTERLLTELHNKIIREAFEGGRFDPVGDMAKSSAIKEKIAQLVERNLEIESKLREYRMF